MFQKMWKVKAHAKRWELIKGTNLANEGDSDIVSKFQRLSILSINEILTVGMIVKDIQWIFQRR